MAKILTSRGLVAALAAAVLGLGFAFGVATTSAQAVDDITVGSATVAPGDTVTINVTGSGSGIGSYGINIEYDSTLVSVSTCSSTNGVCNPEFAANTIRINGSNLSGISGDDVVLGSIVFIAGSDEGVAALEVVAADISDTTGATLTVTPTDGAITIVEATPTPEPTAAPTDAPSATVTPAAPPATGGNPGETSSNAMTLVLAAAGMMIVAGGAWVFARRVS